MVRSPLVRVLALFVTLSGAFSAPMLAVTHGIEHLREVASEAHGHDHVGPSDRLSTAGHDAQGVESAVGKESGDSGHRHPSIDNAVGAKSVVALHALLATPVIVPEALGQTASVTRAAATAVKRPAAPDDSPPRLRAPPTTRG